MYKKVKRYVREYMLLVTVIGLIVGIIFLIIGILGFMPDYELPFFTDIVKDIGNWYWWFLITALFFFIPGSAWFMYANISDRRRFNDLIDTDSKKVFVSNVDELEEIAFRLGSSYQEELFDKKEELKVK